MRYVEKFKSVAEIEKCAEYYVKLLGLQDWNILYKIGVPNDESWSGQCEKIDEEKCACITIDSRPQPDDCWTKQPQELVLIHELVHCKIILMDNDTVEGKLMYLYYHTLVEDWAKSIFYTRYNLSNADLLNKGGGKKK